MKKIGLFLAVWCWLGAGVLWAHCEMPCGIYDDPARMKSVYEHIETLGKAVHSIGHLQAGKPVDFNQLVRWIVTKDQHADQLQAIVAQYFMTQRIKPVAPDAPGYAKYIRELTLLHQMLVATMKVKQTVDPAAVETLKKSATAFEASYFGKNAE